MGNISPDARKDLITKKAYELFVKRGSKPGHEMDDWLTAEKLVDREVQEKNRETSQGRSEPTPSSQRPVPSPIRNAPSKVSGYKRVTG